MTRPSEAAIRAAILDLPHRRGRAASFCPSEVARMLAADWRGLMPEIRRISATLEAVEAMQRGVPVDPVAARGPIRLRLRVSG